MKKLEEVIESNLRALGDPEDDDFVSTARQIVCPFYKSGGNIDCQGCIQSDDTVEDCKTTYIERIKIRPMEVWSIEFDGIEVREKKALDLNSSMGLRCDMCNISHACPEFKSRATCSIDWSPQTDTSDNKRMINELIELQQARINFAKANELVDGGRPDQSLSVEMDRMSTLIAARADLNSSKFSIQISGKSSGEKKEGILSKVFGSALPVQALAEGEQSMLPISNSNSNDNSTFSEAIVVSEKKPIETDANKLEFTDEVKTFRQQKAEKIQAEKEASNKSKKSKK